MNPEEVAQKDLTVDGKVLFCNMCNKPCNSNIDTLLYYCNLNVIIKVHLSFPDVWDTCTSLTCSWELVTPVGALANCCNCKYF
jgi:hypothetical protein